jgi:hypothetical protein
MAISVYFLPIMDDWMSTLPKLFFVFDPGRRLLPEAFEDQIGQLQPNERL